MAQLLGSSFSFGRLGQCGNQYVPSLAVLLALLMSGCASITNPIAEGIPVRFLPTELLAKPKDDARTIPLSLLGQPPPDEYRLAPGDILGVWIENVLQAASKEKPAIASVNTAPLVQQRDQRRLPPTLGYPIPIRPDGTIWLPSIEPLRVTGMSVEQAEDAIRNTYVKNKVLREEPIHVLVTLMHPRQTQVVVLRQESGNITLTPGGGLTGAKRNTGHLVDLPAYENDVLHAIAQTGGMPSLDAYNQIIIFRNAFGDDRDRLALLEKVRAMPPGGKPQVALGNGVQAICIPLRLRPGEPLPFGPQDMLLHTGDVVFIEARDPDLFYTAGLLPSGEHILPRDYDLDVVKAIARVQGPLINGAYGTNNLSGNLIQPGLGGPSPTLLTVLRKTPDGGSVPIYVDLARALRDPRERILVRAGDVLIMQEKPSEALSRYVSQTFFNFNIIWSAFRSNAVTGIVNVAAPDRLASPALTVTQP